MAMQAIETDSGTRGASRHAGAVPMQALAGAPAETRFGPCGQARAGCAASCPRFGQCGPSDRQAAGRARLVPPRITA